MTRHQVLRQHAAHGLTDDVGRSRAEVLDESMHVTSMSRPAPYDIHQIVGEVFSG